MDKRGIMKIIEASAAILIIFIAILTLSMTRRASTEIDLSDKITPLLEEIAKNNAIRDKVVENSADVNETLESFLSARIIEPNIGYNFSVCINLNEICSMQGNYPKDIVGNVYAGSRIISSSLSKAEPKRVAIFLWFKK